MGSAGRGGRAARRPTFPEHCRCCPGTDREVTNMVTHLSMNTVPMRLQSRRSRMDLEHTHPSARARVTPPRFTRLLNSSPPQLLNSSTPQLLNSSTPQLLNSSTPQLLNSSTPQLLNSSTPQLLNSSPPLRYAQAKRTLLTQSPASFLPDWRFNRYPLGGRSNGFLAFITLHDILADAFIQSDLQLIRLRGRHTPWSNLGFRALLKEPTAVQILSWPDQGSNHRPCGSMSSSLTTTLQAAFLVNGRITWHKKYTIQSLMYCMLPPAFMWEL